MRSLSRAGAAMLLASSLTGCGADSTPTGVTGDGVRTGRPLPSVTPAPVIGVSPAGLSFVVYAFRPAYEPPKQTLKITNLGGGVLTWTALDNASWVREGSTSGTAPSTVTVRAIRAAIPIGINGYRPRYLQAAITISARGASNTPVTVPVSVIISYQR
jgi:hypothetical protein